MKPFIVATKNQGKLMEIKSILHTFPFQVISMEEAGFNQDINETGTSFAENALIKAKEIYTTTQAIVMADDSGLEVEYLNGSPGIYSSRYAGIGSSSQDKMNALLHELKGVPFEKRQARFVCSICVFYGDHKNFIVEGFCNGFIALSSNGNNGFGYDPIFYLPEYNRTMAQLTPDEKNKISHRGNALVQMVEQLKKISLL